MKSDQEVQSRENLKSQFETRYKKLNKAQKQAVDTIEGPLLVVAGPGSGKTEILSLRVAKILKETQSLPSNILCLTFTDSASVNMRERLAKLIGQEAYRVAIHTFHSFAVDIIQKYPEFFYKGAIFTPVDPISKIAILEEIFEKLPYSNPLSSSHPEQGFVYLGDTANIIGNLKKAGITEDELDVILAQNEMQAGRVSEILSPIVEKRVSESVIAELEQARMQILKEDADIAGLANADSAQESLKGALKGIAAAEIISQKTGIHSLYKAVALSLEEALIKRAETEKNEPISKWKEKWFKKDDSNQKVFRDILSGEKMKAVAHIYREYRHIMHTRCLFDFDDMILDLISAIELNPRLRYDLQEQYQYILVDEFQDTNNAQMRIVKLIADAPVHEGHPNIMVVGDDDQAVYKFQGAELSNILNFQTIFKDVSVVNMTANYRSTQDILDIATHVIRKGEHRLENLIPQLEKTLISSNPEIKKGSIIHKVFDTSLHEFHYVSRRIRALIDQGAEPKEIAVIARKHKQLESLVPYLQGAGVPIRYEREQNVFEQPHIVQLILMARFINSLSAKDTSEADEYLPKILAFPFWQLPRMTVWNISKKAYADRKTWLECMLENEATRPIAEFFIELGERATHEALESVLDTMIGAHVQLVQESEDEEEGDGRAAGEDGEKEGTGDNGNDANKNARRDVDNSSMRDEDGKLVSPFKTYYFSKERFNHARAEYLSFLSSLRVFVRALREYKGKRGVRESLYIQDLVDFVDIHEKNNIALNDQSPFANATDAVNLLSSHKAKGLEFDTVFVLSCTDDIWAGRGLSNKITMPANMPIEPAGDTEDDQLRLFYVALTRAKRNLYLTSYKVKDDGKQSMMLRFLTTDDSTRGGADVSGKDIAAAKLGKDIDGTKVVNADDKLEKDILKKLYEPESGDEETFASNYVPETHELLTASWLLYHTPPFFGEEESLLKSLLERYQLSVTHLNNYLNVTKGGPRLFLEQNLLRFPQAKSPSGAYGSAIHKTLERFSIKLRHGGRGAGDMQNGSERATLDEVLAWFSEYLAHERLSKQDFKQYADRGASALTKFYEAKQSDFSPEDKTEVNFKDQGVILQSTGTGMEIGADGVSRSRGTDAHITGKIDRIIQMGGGKIVVCDFKTGKAKKEWAPKGEYEKIKLHEYERQLLFYKLLIDNSRDYKNMYTVSGGKLMFVEPLPNGQVVELHLDFDEEKLDRVRRLACVVYKKITELDFPDTSKDRGYGEKLEDIIAFEDSLLG
jgi:DNA helicase-2/ATP-dependent DNA helicase PcrA